MNPSAPDDDESIGDMWRGLKAQRQEKRAGNRKSSPALLNESGIAFASKNGGAHLVVKAKGHVINFWPGTGLWMLHGSTKRHGGVRSLIKFCKGQL